MRNSLLLALFVVLVAGVVPAAGMGAEPGRAAAPAPLLGPELQISRASTGAGEDWFRPAAAYNTLRGSQVVFTHAHSAAGGDVYGYYWSPAPNDWVWFWALSGVQPAVAYNRADDDFLLVSMYDSDQDGRYEIWGRVIEGDASSMGAPFLIFQWANRSFWSPRVAWNGLHDEYLVVWGAVDTTTGLPSDVAAARVSPEGAVLPGAPHLVATAGTPHQPDVAYNVAADEYLVAWRCEGLAADWDICGARLRGSDAAVVSPPGAFVVNSTPEDQAAPAVATNQQGRYLVLWEHAYPGPCCDWDIRGQELDVAGAPAGGVVMVSQTLDDETAPRVVARPGPVRDYLAVWQKATDTGSEIWASRWGQDGVQYDYFQVAAAAWWDHAAPAVVAAGGHYLVAYEADAQGDPTVLRHIYGRFWAPHGLFLPVVARGWP
ncbi:MAG TPA: hypothetical protein VLC95_12420 [Anaerolineae bacterium]|nr:hypothetical protein [Anaerolineae bacterium]